MSEARDALLDIKPDILCLQEVRDYESVQQLIEVLPRFHVYVVSRFRERIGDILGIQQTAICGTRHAEAAWSESWQRGKSDPPSGFHLARFVQPTATIFSLIVSTSKATSPYYQMILQNEKMQGVSFSPINPRWKTCTRKLVRCLSLLAEI